MEFALRFTIRFGTAAGSLFHAERFSRRFAPIWFDAVTASVLASYALLHRQPENVRLS